MDRAHSYINSGCVQPDELRYAQKVDGAFLLDEHLRILNWEFQTAFLDVLV